MKLKNMFVGQVVVVKKSEAADGLLFKVVVTYLDKFSETFHGVVIEDDSPEFLNYNVQFGFDPEYFKPVTHKIINCDYQS